MKTYVIRLQNYDDLLTIRDKISWSSTSRVILVFPEGKKPVNNQVDFALLRHFSNKYGYQLAVVIKDDDWRMEAGRSGLIYFDSLRQAQNSTWKRQRMPFKPTPDNLGSRLNRQYIREGIERKKYFNQIEMPGKKSVVISLALLAITLVLFMIFFIPAAKITLTPEYRSIETTFSISANPEAHSVYSGGGIPARLETVSMTGEEQAEASGTALLPETYAEGEISISNLSGEAVNIPAGTIVMAGDDSEKRYETLQDIDLEANADDVDLAIRAVSAGGRMNVDAGVITTIEKDYGLKIKLVNKNPVGGGTDRSVRAVSEDDYIRLKNRIINRLQPEARNLISERLKSEQTLVGSMIQFSQVDEETLDHTVGQAADTVTLSMKISFQGWVVEKKDVEVIAGMNLASKTEENEEAVPGSLRINSIGAPVTRDGQISWQIKASRSVRAILPLETIKEQITGMPAGMVADKLEREYKLLKKPELEVFPIGWPVMPFYFMKINLVVN